MHTPYYIFEENGGDYGEIVERAYLLMSQTSISSAVSLEDELRAFIQIQYPFPPDPLATDPLLPWRLSFLLRHLECGTGSELFRLLLEARPHSSKWFDPGRLGQAELYEGLERVLLDLKAFSPHSTPFLHRVSKKAVPDYCNVILRPMDLGTMHKKLRNREYASKQEFAADLQLIHDNCLTYNTEEASPLRKSVVLLREKWTLLMQRVPDIKIQPIGMIGGVANPVEEDEFLLDSILDEHLEKLSADSNSRTTIDFTFLGSGTPVISTPKLPSTQMVFQNAVSSLENWTDIIEHRSELTMGKASALMKHPPSPEIDLLFLFNSVPDVKNIIPHPSHKASRHNNQSQKRISQYLEAISTQQQLFNGQPSPYLSPTPDTSWALERYIALELLLQGYESSQRSCLKTLTQALQQLLLNAVSKLRRCIDKNPRSPERAASQWVLGELDLSPSEVKCRIDVLDRRLDRWSLLSKQLEKWDEEAKEIAAQVQQQTSHSQQHLTSMEDTLSDVEIDEEEYIIPRTELTTPTEQTMDVEEPDEDGEDVESASESLSSTTVALKRSRIS